MIPHCPIDPRDRKARAERLLPWARLTAHGEPLVADRVIAMVGSRAASAAGMQKTETWGAALALGATIVSGGALGIDAAAHRGAARTGTTWVVLGSGVDVWYPARNQELFRSVLAAGGTLVSPFAHGAPPLRQHFLRRNEVIAALADVVIVVEAAERSGSLATATAAKRLGVPLGAVPGSAGADGLLAAGAALIESAADITALLHGRARRIEVATPNGLDGDIVIAVRQGARSADAIATELGLNVRVVQKHLFDLEMQGWVTNVCDQLAARPWAPKGASV